MSLTSTLLTAVPPLAPLVTAPLSPTATIGRCAVGVVWVAGTGVVTSVEVTLALLTMEPLLTSARVTVWVPVSTQVALTATVAQVWLFGVSWASLTTTLLRVTLPVLVAVIV